MFALYLNTEYWSIKELLPLLFYRFCYFFLLQFMSVETLLFSLKCLFLTIIILFTLYSVQEFWIHETENKMLMKIKIK